MTTEQRKAGWLIQPAYYLNLNSVNVQIKMNKIHNEQVDFQPLFHYTQVCIL